MNEFEVKDLTNVKGEMKLSRIKINFNENSF